MFVMEGRQKPPPAPHKHLLIAQRRVGGGKGCYRLPCLSACHYCACSELPGTGVQPPKLSSLRIQSHSSASVLQMLTKLLLQAGPWHMTHGLDCSGPTYLLNAYQRMHHRTQLNWPLAASGPNYSSCCLFRAAFPLWKKEFFSLRLPCSICTPLRSPMPRCLWDFYLLLSHRLCHLTRKR